jgi:F-box protein 18 (helicase)
MPEMNSREGIREGTKSLKLTEEQRAILASEGDIRINACAGSGKTTTIIAYARTRPAGSRILYLAFNRSVKLEAQRRFAAEGLNNVTVETAHSLAYRYVVARQGYKVRAQGYKAHEVVSLLGLKGNGEPHTEYIIATHILKLVSLFCNSNVLQVQELNYLAVVQDKKARSFVRAQYAQILQGARRLLARMNSGELEIIHDFYLKKFQLSCPQLPYDYLLFDEGQDASAAMLDIFMRQNGTHVIVGDTHQQIYGWRYAVNSLERVDFPSLQLSTSFRFNQVVANLAAGILGWKENVGAYDPVVIKGAGKYRPHVPSAIIARTNLGLLLKAIEVVTENKKKVPIYFEGSIHSYTYADEGTSLYDVLNLHNRNFHLIRDPLVKSMHSVADLEEYIEKTEDPQLGMMLEIVNKYGNQIPSILQTLKDRHVGDEDRDKAELIFSTVHRCKGMEYEGVELVGDFISQSRLQREMESKEEDVKNPSRWIEEINLLYVAVTRTKGSLRIPENLLPANFPLSSQIELVVPKTEKPDSQPEVRTKPRRLRPINREEKIRLEKENEKKGKESYQSWTAAKDRELMELYESLVPVPTIAKKLGRTEGAIMMRIRSLSQMP